MTIAVFYNSRHDNHYLYEIDRLGISDKELKRLAKFFEPKERCIGLINSVEWFGNEDVEPLAFRLFDLTLMAGREKYRTFQDFKKVLSARTRRELGDFFDLWYKRRYRRRSWYGAKKSDFKESREFCQSLFLLPSAPTP